MPPPQQLPDWVQVGSRVYVGPACFVVARIDDDGLEVLDENRNLLRFTREVAEGFRPQPDLSPVPPGTSLTISAPRYLGSMPVRVDISIGGSLPSEPAEVIAIGLPMEGVVSEMEAHPLGTIQVLRNVRLPFASVTPGQVVQVTQDGAVQNYTVVSVDTTVSQQGSGTLATLREQRVELPGWMRTGARLSSRGGGDQVTITGIVNGAIHVRDIERTDPIVLGGMVRAFTPQQIEQLFQPEEVPTPRWFTEGARIVQAFDGAIFQIESIDSLVGAFTATRPDEPRRPQRFNLLDIERHWRPYTSLNETFLDPVTRRPTTPRPVLSTTIPAPPPWLQGGVLIRPQARDRRRTFWVASLHPERGMCRIQVVESVNPLKMAAQWEELAFETAQTSWEPLNADGTPIHERRCPHCGEYGGRDKEAEETSAYQVRIYHCAGGHSWSFVDGGFDDGKPAAPTRFERDFDL